MKPRGSKESEKSKVLLRSHLCESTDRDNARHEIGMGILWLVLGTACAALAVDLALHLAEMKGISIRWLPKQFALRLRCPLRFFLHFRQQPPELPLF